ncbi:MAG: thioredoxin family protein [Pseudomonadota bacterium]
MKKTKRKPSKPAARSPARQADPAPPRAQDRRAFLNRLSWIGLAAGVAGGGVFLGARSVTARMEEGDLERIGQGIPAVVQVHDPTCPSCAALQKQARRAMRDFSDDSLIFLVADQTTQQGRDFAQAFGVTHITLVLLNGQGEHVETLQGVRPAAELRPAFLALAD